MRAHFKLCMCNYFGNENSVGLPVSNQQYVSTQTEHMHSLSQQFPARYMFNRNANTHLPKDKNVHSSTLCNSLKPELL